MALLENESSQFIFFLVWHLMDWVDSLVSYHEWVGYGMIITSIITFIACMVKTAPYGRHSNSSSPKYWGPAVPAVLAWMIMEAPSPLLVMYYFVTFSPGYSTSRIILFAMYQLHYFNR